MNEIEFLFYKNFNGKMINGNLNTFVGNIALTAAYKVTVTPTVGTYCYLHMAAFGVTNCQVPVSGYLSFQAVINLGLFSVNILQGSKNLGTIYERIMGSKGNFLTVNGTNNIIFQIGYSINNNVNGAFSIDYAMILFD